MDWKSEFKLLFWGIFFFLAFYFMPIETANFQHAIIAAFDLAKWYAREHVLLCLVPAFFIAGTIAVFVSQAAVIKYFGASAKKWIAYAVASVSGSILAVCSCTILPLFSGIHKRGAGLGPAIAFLYSGPAINILAIILTARVLGLDLGLARVIGAVSFSVIIGFVMHLIYRKEEQEKAKAEMLMPMPEESRPLWQTIFHFISLVGILIFATWGKPAESTGLWALIYSVKWWLVGFFSVLLAYSLVSILQVNRIKVIVGAIIVVLVTVFFGAHPEIPFITGVVIVSILISTTPGEPSDWMSETWGFTKQILPLLAAGVLVAGFLLGTPEGGHGIVPDHWITSLVGGNSVFANFFASIVGAFMYFATLTEIPILQGLLGAGMGKGPALALLLAGPALSLPNMLVIRSVIGTQKTAVYVTLVVIMSTIAGLIYGGLF
ncbi:MAG: permease [Calditrichia bacterium]